MGTAGKVAASAVVGGLVSEASGGKFGSGVLAAGFSSLAGSQLGNLGVAGNAVAGAVIGGVSSVLGGGKFANGAVTGAFSYLATIAIRGGDSQSIAEEETYEQYRQHLLARGIDPDNKSVSLDMLSQMQVTNASPDFQAEAQPIFDASVATHTETGGVYIISLQGELLGGVDIYFTYQGAPAVCSSAASACMGTPP